MNSTSNLRNPFIDLIRYIASILVALFHWNSTERFLQNTEVGWLISLVKSGAVGVPIFFIVSGYVIAGAATRAKSYYHFGASRIIRIFPLLFFASITSVIVNYFFLNPLHDPIRVIIGSTTLLFEVLAIQPFSTILWTLLIEVKFYVMITILILISKRNFSNPYFMICLLYLFSLMDTLQVPIYSTIDSSMRNYLDYFCLGIAIFCLRFQSSNLMHLVLVLCQVLFYFYRSVIRDFYTGNLNWYLVLLASTSILLLFRPRFSATLTSRFFGALGNASYGIYLFHIDVGALILNWFILYLKLSPLLSAAITSILLSIICILVHRVIEVPSQSFLRGMFLHSRE